MNVKVLLAIIASSGIGILLIILMYYNGPTYALEQYFKFINQKQYQEAYAMLYQDETLQTFSKDEILGYYEKIYSQRDYLITVSKESSFIYKDITEESKNIKTAFCNVKYIFDSKTEEGSIVLIKENKKWKIKMPFKKESLKIYAPLGSKVYLNNSLIEDNNENPYKEKMVLPGKYSVKVVFDNPLYNEYITTVSVPETTELFLPYNMLRVSINTYKNSIVELAGCKKKSTAGTLQFDNLLQGKYSVRIYDENGLIEPKEEQIEVHHDAKIFDIKNYKLSSEGKTYLDKFLKDFYTQYKKGIEDHTTDDLYEYFDYKNRIGILSEFNSWFIENKDIKEAVVNVIVEETSINNDGQLEAVILEDTTLTNREVDEYNNETMQDYRLVLKWKVTIHMDNKEDWKITDKVILGSTVAYKDLEGKWTEY